MSIFRRLKNLWDISGTDSNNVSMKQPTGYLPTEDEYFINKTKNVGLTTMPQAIIIKRNKKDPVKEIINEINEN